VKTIPGTVKTVPRISTYKGKIVGLALNTLATLLLWRAEWLGTQHMPCSYKRRLFPHPSATSVVVEEKEHFVTRGLQQKSKCYKQNKTKLHADVPTCWFASGRPYSRLSWESCSGLDTCVWWRVRVRTPPPRRRVLSPGPLSWLAQRPRLGLSEWKG